MIYVLYTVTDEETTLLVSKGTITSTPKPHHLYGPQAIELIMRKTSKTVLSLCNYCHFILFQ